MESVSIEYKMFPDGEFMPGDKSDALQCIGKQFNVKHCYIDASKWGKGEIDEALGITWGACGVFEECVFRGAGKLVLCGSGDKDKADLENGRQVTFIRCLFEDFGRRGPEVQSNMIVFMRQCVIRNWGDPDKFDTRAFGAWAHNGGKIVAEDCVFIQEHKPTFRLWAKDKIAHIGQSVNDEGIRGLFHPRTYVSGWKRGLTQGPDGDACAHNCYASKGVTLDNRVYEMDELAARALTEKMDRYAQNLHSYLLRRTKNESQPIFYEA